MAGETRAQVMSALFGLISNMTFATPVGSGVGASAWVTKSQRLRLWGDVPPEQQPAVFLVTHREMDEFRNLGLTRRRLELQAWCYVRTDDPTAVGQTYLDTMLESFEQAINLAVDDPSHNANTLGGLVYFCRIEGRVFKDPGDIDNQAMMIVPIVVEMP